MMLLGPFMMLFLSSMELYSPRPPSLCMVNSRANMFATNIFVVVNGKKTMSYSFKLQSLKGTVSDVSLTKTLAFGYMDYQGHVQSTFCLSLT